MYIAILFYLLAAKLMHMHITVITSALEVIKEYNKEKMKDVEIVYSPLADIIMSVVWPITLLIFIYKKEQLEKDTFNK